MKLKKIKLNKNLIEKDVLLTYSEFIFEPENYQNYIFSSVTLKDGGRLNCNFQDD